MKLLDLNALSIFKTVVTEGGIAKAANKLHRVQSNVSTRIKNLEQQLDTVLFFREGRKLVLSPEGELLLAYTDKLLALAEEAQTSLTGGTLSGSFRIGSMESTAAARLPPILSSFNIGHPKIEMTVSTGTSDSLVEQLVDYKIDAAFVAEPILHQAIASQHAFDEELVLISPKSIDMPIRAGSIHQLSAIAFKPGCAYRRYLEQWLHQLNAKPRSIIEVGSYHAIIACVAAGSGIAIIPKYLLETLVTQADINVSALPAAISKVATVLAYRKQYTSKKLDALLHCLEGNQNSL